jgi:hypothetical protein
MVQRLALEADAIAHKTPTVREFFEVGKREAHKSALVALGRYR